MKKVLIIAGIAIAGFIAYYFWSKPNGTKCDCAVQSYYDANKDYCNELNLSDPAQAWGAPPPSFSHCNFDVKYELDPTGEYSKFDAITAYDQNGLPFWAPVVMRDDGKHPDNEHADQIEMALKTMEPTKFEN